MSRKTSGRRPTAYEQALWNKVIEKATPLSRTDKETEAPSSKPAVAVKKHHTGASSAGALPATKFTVGQAAKSVPRVPDLAPHPSEQFGTPRMDRKQHGRLTRGKLDPEARLDLHGMTLADAHPALIRFILAAHAAGKRLVLVITGKGKDRDEGGPIPTRTGVLRHQVPDWLQSGPLTSAVLDIATAHRKHGGSGAYYVYLRRRR